MENKKILKSSKNSYFGSIVFLLVIVSLTIGLFFYNNHLVKVTKTLQNTVDEYTKSIESYKLNEEFKIYSLIEVNKKNLAILESNSRITTFLNHMNDIKDDYNLSFRWFNFNSSIIWTSVILDSDEYNELDYKLAYQKFVEFVWEYRNDANALFDLAFINRISWHDQMKFNLNFTIKQ